MRAFILYRIFIILKVHLPFPVLVCWQLQASRIPEDTTGNTEGDSSGHSASVGARGAQDDHAQEVLKGVPWRPSG